MTEPGRQLGKYELRAQLGRGAMGTVWEGWDPAIARRVAIKTVRIPDQTDAEAVEMLQRFRREAQAAGQLHHPNIVGVYDYGEADDLAYIVMEFVDGRTLKALLDAEERLPLAEVGRLMGEILSGLAYSHGRGVVHRDIKPANIILTAQGQAKIADFGIARIDRSSLTQAGTRMGTPAYMSPEQFMGQVVDARSDIWSAGVLLYQLLTGERPFEGGETAIMHKVLNTEPPRPSELSVTVPLALDAVVTRAMAKRPDARWPDAAGFAAGLALAFAAPAVPDADATVMVAPRRAAPAAAAPTAAPAAPVRRFPIAAAMAAGVLALLGAGGWFLLGGPSRPVSSPPVAYPPVASPPVASLAVPTPAPAAAPASSEGAVPVVPTRAPPGSQVATTAASTAPAALPEVAPPESVQPPVPAPAVTPPTSVLPVIPPTPHVTPEPSATLASPPIPASPPPVTTPATPPPPAIATPAPPPAAPEPESGTGAVAALGPPPTPAARTPPLPSPESLREALRAIPCSLPASQAEAGRISLRGVVGMGEPERRLRDTVGDVAGSRPVAWGMQPVEPVFCPALDTLASAGQGATGTAFAVSLAGGRTLLKEGDLITVHLQGPDFPAYVHVSYLVHDGTLAHLLQASSDPARRLGAGAAMRLGDPAQGGASWAAGPPYGRDLLVAIATSAPLFARPRPDDEGIEPFLRDLRAALGQARQRGVRIAADAWVVEVAPR